MPRRGCCLPLSRQEEPVASRVLRRRPGRLFRQPRASRCSAHSCGARGTERSLSMILSIVVHCRSCTTQESSKQDVSPFPFGTRRWREMGQYSLG